MSPDLLDLLKEALKSVGVILAAIAAPASAILVAKRAGKTAREANAINWAAALSDRLDKTVERLDAVEEKLDASETVTRISVGYIERLIRWVRAHVPHDVGAPPMPMPPSELHDYLPEDLR